MVAKMIAFDEVMQVAADQADAARSAMERADQRRTCKWMSGDLRRGMTEAQVRRSAVKKLKPKSIDWDKVIAFIEKVMPLILVMINKV